MHSRTRERVEQWDSRSFTGGFDELGRLAVDGFSGAISANNAWLFSLNGRVVGIVDGDLDDFAEASGTCYTAPDPALPLLWSMLEQEGETRATYYTKETPLSEVDATLREGSFTGYVELCENVLTGDYYLVYYGGKRMAVGFVGNDGRLLTDEEAFERAVGEVGIYNVINVTVNVVDVPTAPDQSVDATDSAPAPTETTENAGETDDSEPPTVNIADPTATEATAEPTTPEATDEPPRPVTDLTSVDLLDSEGDEYPTSEQETEPAALEEEPSTNEEDSVADDPAPPSVSIDGLDLTDGTVSDSKVADSDESPGDGEPTQNDESAGQDSDVTETDEDEDRHTPSDDVSPAEAPSLSTQSVDQSPSVDSADRSPDTSDEDTSEDASETPWVVPSVDPANSEPAVDLSPEEKSLKERAQPSPTERQDTAKGGEEVALNAETAAELRQLYDQVERLEAERDQLETENEALEAKLSKLEATIRELETAEPASEQSMAQTQALAESHLFVRYRSQSKPKLRAALDDGANRSDVVANLQLEHHTEFEKTAVTVAGQPYREFLHDSLEYQVIDWLVSTLVYDIRDTGNTDKLADFYSILPLIDRIDFQSTVRLADGDDAEEVTFDVLAVNKRGKPLLAIALSDGREPVAGHVLEDLESAASAVAAQYPTFGGALAVTASYFEPSAIEVVEAATKNGFLSRSSKLSYVSVSRKQGYHLCLVEAREGSFHLTVPEL